MKPDSVMYVPEGLIGVATAATMSMRPSRSRSAAGIPAIFPIMSCASPLKRLLIGVLIPLVLCGCAGMESFREGNRLLAEGKTGEGLSKLEEAVRLEPNNAEYRIALTSRRAAVITRGLALGDAHRRDDRPLEAERSYEQVLTLDPDNAMAKQGLAALSSNRKADGLVAEARDKARSGRAQDIDSALDLLRGALHSAPEHRAAAALKQSLEDARAKLAKAETRLSAAYRKPITLEFRDAPIKTVFDLISKVSGLNFFFDRDIRPDVRTTILVKNTTIEDAVKTILVTTQLEQVVLNDNSVLIYPSTPQKLKDYQQLSVRSFYVTNADVNVVSNSIKTIVKTRDLVIDERLGIIIMRDTPQAIRLAERIVELQDLTDPEVMLELEVMEVKRTKLLELGINWPASISLSPLSTTGGTTLTVADLRNLNSSSLGASVRSTVINANRQLTDGNLLANPRIRVRNKEKARVLIGDRVPVITTTSVATGFVSESISYVDVGLKLDVEPTIYLDQEVAIKVNLEVSNLVREISTANGTLAYQIGTRNAGTVLRLKDGETQILAGLISDEDRMTSSRVPALGDLPLVGRLFGTQKDDSNRNEILLSITPRVVRSIRRPEILAAEFESGTESRVGAEPLSLAPSTPADVPVVPNAAPNSATGAAPSTAPLAAPNAAVRPAIEPPTSSAASSSASPSQEAAESLRFSWQIPAQVKVGERFTATLRAETPAALRGLPVLIQFDPQLLELVGAQEGELFKRTGPGSRFSSHVDQTQGKAFIATSLAAGAVGTGPSTGSVAAFQFKALKAQSSPAIQILSASPEAAVKVTVQSIDAPVVGVLP
jgi:general secretion pathway protein D